MPTSLRDGRLVKRIRSRLVRRAAVNPAREHTSNLIRFRACCSPRTYCRPPQLDSSLIRRVFTAGRNFARSIHGAGDFVGRIIFLDRGAGHGNSLTLRQHRTRRDVDRRLGL